MCFDTSPVGGVHRWNWEGDAVVFDTTVPSHRSVVGTKRRYEIDVRSFVRWEKNTVITKTLKDGVRPFAATLRRGGASLFEARDPGAFDFRAHVIKCWIGQHIKYSMKRGQDPWQFPDETLTLERGDCEDLAFLTAALLLGSGVSGYHVRVAIGEVRVGERLKYDHAWVMYKDEVGSWQLVEPLRLFSPRSPKPRDEPRNLRLLSEPVRYVPSFLFNDEHLWIVARRGNPAALGKVARRRWNRMSPKFAGDVHLSILDRALFDAPAEFRSKLRDRFARVAGVGPLIDPDDWVDVLNPSATPYDPRQHFDNSLISESWDLLENNAARFRAKRADVKAFGSAAHAIADFYAHSSYLAFASLSVGLHSERKASLYHPDRWNDEDHLSREPHYGPDGAFGLGFFDLHRFSRNHEVWKRSVAAGIAAWNGKLISGRYAQSANDRLGSVSSKLAESMCSLPKKYLRPEIGAVPHHSEIAVDDADWTPNHRLFKPEQYALQYRWRVNTAVAHVRKLWKTGVP